MPSGNNNKKKKKNKGGGKGKNKQKTKAQTANAAKPHPVVSSSDAALAALRLKYTLLGKAEWWWLMDDTLQELCRSLRENFYCVIDGFLGGDDGRCGEVLKVTAGGEEAVEWEGEHGLMAAGDGALAVAVTKPGHKVQVRLAACLFDLFALLVLFVFLFVF